MVVSWRLAAEKPVPGTPRAHVFFYIISVCVCVANPTTMQAQFQWCRF